jgi:hypothetical protein
VAVVSWQLVWWLPNWLAARVLDGFAGAEDIPDVLGAWGIVSMVVAAVVFTRLVAGWWLRRRAERGQSPPGNLLDEQDWLADRTEEIPAPPERRYRGRRRAGRERRGRRPRQHVVPAHPIRAEVAATQVIAWVADDPEATAVLVRPPGRWGAW